MSVKCRFFARFRELFGTEVIVDVPQGTSLVGLIRIIAQKNPDGHAAIFDEHGSLREFVILMRNTKRIDLADADTTMIADGDDIAVFPPVAGG